uniref:Stimulated by retinoic acid 8 n=1 Tax=Coturnix japonica TaxID=93934 RepID=A0A8C2T9L3_COTJA
MEAAGGCAELCARARPAARLQPQEVEPRAARRRLAQAQHRAVLAGLFSSLQETVLAQSDSPASKVRAKGLTSVIVVFLLTAESFSLEDGNPSSLEEVREEYIKRYFSNQRCSCGFFSPPCVLFSTASPSEAVSESDSAVWYLMQECEKQTMEEDGKPGLIQYPETSSPDLVEFERYLYFYKNTVDLLREHGIVSAEEVPLPVVSTAISHLWQELSEERRDSILQYCSQRDFHLGPTNACQESACTGGDVRDSGGNSEEASGSLVSTPEEVSAHSSFTSGISENAEDDQRLYLQITDFLKSLFFANTQFCQVSFAKGFLVKGAVYFCHCQKEISLVSDHSVQNH